MLPREDTDALIESDDAQRGRSRTAGAYYRSKAPVYYYHDLPSGEGISDDAGALVGLMVCLCLLLLLAFSVSYPLSSYYYTTPEEPPTKWRHGNEMYARPP